MKFFLIIVVMLLLSLFIFLMVTESKTKQEKEQTGSKQKQVKKERAGQDGGTSGMEAVRRRCFDLYCAYLSEEQKFKLCRQVFCERGVFLYLRELYAFRKLSTSRRMMSNEYRKLLLEGILDPMREAVSTSFPFRNGIYCVPEQFDLFLTPEEYYEQQLSYRNSQEQGSSEEKFWTERLLRSDEKLKKLEADAGNQFFRNLWDLCRPLLEEAEGLYRERILEAPGREAADLLTKDFTERFEEALYRGGVRVLWYAAASPEEREQHFTRNSGQGEKPALLREEDGLNYVKGNF